MQKFNIRQGGCHPSAQAEQAINCTQKVQRVRCCGRVLSEQEVSFERMGNGQCKRMVNGQGKRMGNGQGKRMENGQGKRMGNGQQRV